MLAEALAHLLLPCPRRLKRLGVLRELIALRARHRRCRAAWAPHLDAARAAVLDLAPPRGGLAVVLGAGALWEVPLDALRARFASVVLVDLWFWPAVRRAAAARPGVACRTHDLTGLLERLDDLDPAAAPPPPVAALPADLRAADLVISANCLTQLPLIPLRAAEAAGLPAATRTAWAPAIITAHLEALAACPGPVVLLTDHQAEWVRPDGSLAEAWDLLHGAALPPLEAARTWAWEIAPPGERFRHDRERRRMVAGRLAGTGGRADSPSGGDAAGVPPAADRPAGAARAAGDCGPPTAPAH